MGTNFYYRKSGADADRHIGKSSGGWVFLVRLYPERGINSLDDWKTLLVADPTGKILDEYGRTYTVGGMMSWIEGRHWTAPYRMSPEELVANCAEYTAGNLLRPVERHEEGRTVRNGEGTYSYVYYDFR